MPRLPGSNIVASFIYGTAWKKQETAALVHRALAAGFRAIDTAAQPKHYQEHLVGEGIRDAIRAGVVTRDDLHVQTKYTPISGQDPRNMPYDAELPIASQVQTSVASSLRNLRLTDTEDDDSNYIDCLVLHSPLQTVEKTLEAWRAMSSFVPHRVRSLGISNVNLAVLQAICNQADIAPALVQNRFYKATGYDVQLRAFCRERDIVYESFWTLTGNPHLVKSALVREVSSTIGIDKELALYALVSALDIAILNGTTNSDTMARDLSGMAQVEVFKSQPGHMQKWDAWVKQVKQLLGPLSRHV